MNGGGIFSMLASDFIHTSEQFEKVELLQRQGSTSLSYRVRLKGKDYFMKQLRPEHKDNWRYRVMFHKEFEVGNRIDSDYIVKYVSLNENEKGIYLLLEHINGLTLEEKIAKEPKYFRKTKHLRKFFIQLMKGLKALHDKHVAYLDLKPDNILITQINNDVKIVDLGFCFEDHYGYTAGTNSQFAAPELQSKNREKFDARSDIYAVGKIMLYIQEKCQGRQPCYLRKILEKCTQELPENRYLNADEALRDIRFRRNLFLCIFGFTLALVIFVLIATIFIQQHHLRSMQEEIEALEEQVDITLN